MVRDGWDVTRPADIVRVQGDKGERLVSLATPTTLVLGSADRLVPAGASAQAASGVASMEVTTLAGGHCVHEELPELVYPLIALKLA